MSGNPGPSARAARRYNWGSASATAQAVTAPKGRRTRRRTPPPRPRRSSRSLHGAAGRRRAPGRDRRGALNAWSLAEAGTFATVQSGNVGGGLRARRGDFARVSTAALSILFFGLGAFVNSVAVTTLPRRADAPTAGPVLFSLAALIAVIAVLAVADVAPSSVLVPGVSFVAGSAGQRLPPRSRMLYGNVADDVRRAVVLQPPRQGRAPGGHARGRSADLRSVLIFGSVLLAFAAGAFLGFPGPESRRRWRAVARRRDDGGARRRRGHPPGRRAGGSGPERPDAPNGQATAAARFSPAGKPEQPGGEERGDESRHEEAEACLVLRRCPVIAMSMT